MNCSEPACAHESTRVSRVEPQLGSPVVLRSLWGAPVHLVGSACAPRANVRVIARVGSRTSESCGRSPSVLKLVGRERRSTQQSYRLTVVEPFVEHSVAILAAQDRTAQAHMCALLPHLLTNRTCRAMAGPVINNPPQASQILRARSSLTHSLMAKRVTQRVNYSSNSVTANTAECSAHLHAIAMQYSRKKTTYLKVRKPAVRSAV